MKLDETYFLIIILLVLNVTAQEKYTHNGIYITSGYEFGFLDTKIEDTNLTFQNSNIKKNYNHSFVLNGIYRTAFRTNIKLGYSVSINTLMIEGLNKNRAFLIDHNYINHTATIGAGYSFNLKKNLDLSLGMGSGLTFTKKVNIYAKKGEITDQITATNSSLKSGNVYLIPEISITLYLRNENTLTFGSRYFYSLNDQFLEGIIQNSSSNDVSNKTSFTTLNNQLGIYLCYGFNLKKLF